MFDKYVVCSGRKRKNQSQAPAAATTETYGRYTNGSDLHAASHSTMASMHEPRPDSMMMGQVYGQVGLHWQ